METRIGNIVVNSSSNAIEISNFEYNIAFYREMQLLGGALNRAADKIITKSSQNLQDIIDSISAYFSASETMSAIDKKIKFTIQDFFDNPDMIIKKDKIGLFIVDPHQTSGSIKEISKDLKEMGFRVKSVVNGVRIYISTTNKTELKSQAKNKKKPSEKVRYIGKGFEGFSKFQPNVTLLGIDENRIATILYKNIKQLIPLDDLSIPNSPEYRKMIKW